MAPWETKRPRWTKQTTEAAWVTVHGSRGPSVASELSPCVDGGELPRASEQKRKWSERGRGHRCDLGTQKPRWHSNVTARPHHAVTREGPRPRSPAHGGRFPHTPAWPEPACPAGQGSLHPGKVPGFSFRTGAGLSCLPWGGWPSGPDASCHHPPQRPAPSLPGRACLRQLTPRRPRREASSEAPVWARSRGIALRRF